MNTINEIRDKIFIYLYHVVMTMIFYIFVHRRTFFHIRI